MTKFVDINGPVVADTVYDDGTLVARDVDIDLPAVTPTTAELKAMGTLTFPVWQLLENMEAAIKKIGLDKGLRSMIKPDMKPIECRWVQTVTEANGKTRNVGCKAFLRGMPLDLPGIGVAVGSPGEHPIRISLTRYHLFVDGEEMWLIDRLAGIVRIDGTDYADLDSML